MGFFDLIKQHHRIGFSPHGFRELTTLIITHITRRGSYQTAHRMPLLVFRHVNANHVVLVVEQKFSKGFGKLGLPNTSGSQEDKRTNRTAFILQSGPTAANGIRNGGDGIILTNHPHMQLCFQVHQLLPFTLQHPRHRDTGPPTNHIGYLFGGYLFIHHRGVLLDLRQFVLEIFDRLFSLRDLPITKLGNQAKITLTVSLISFQFHRFYLLFLVLDLIHKVLFGLPLGFHVAAFIIQIGDLFIQIFQLGLVILPLDRLAFNLQLPDPAFNLFQIFGQ